MEMSPPGDVYFAAFVSRFDTIWVSPGDDRPLLLRRPTAAVAVTDGGVALAPDDAALQTVRQAAEKRFGGTGFGLHDGGLIGTPQAIVDRLGALQEMGFAQVVLFTHDRASDATLELLAGEVLPHV